MSELKYFIVKISRRRRPMGVSAHVSGGILLRHQRRPYHGGGSGQVQLHQGGEAHTWRRSGAGVGLGVRVRVGVGVGARVRVRAKARALRLLHLLHLLVVHLLLNTYYAHYSTLTTLTTQHLLRSLLDAYYTYYTRRSRYCPSSLGSCRCLAHTRRAARRPPCG